jgi:S1-C subfamily serine protease
MSIGSGVLIDGGRVLTAWHVLRDAPQNAVVRFRGMDPIPAKFVAGDNNWDIALLFIDIDPKKIEPAKIADRDPIKRDPVTIAGYGPVPDLYRERTGLVTQYLSPAGLGIDELVEVSVTARDGDSGGPMYNQKGEIVGILFGSSDGFTSGACASRLREFIDRQSVTDIYQKWSKP